MSPEEREAMLDAADAFEKARDQWSEILDALTERGFSISLASVRDHTECETCRGRGEFYETADVRGDRFFSNGHECVRKHVVCPGGSPVVWSAEAEER